MNIKSAKYLTSVVEEKNILNDEMIEFAFVGRSNVGKSSLINNLTNQKNLAKTSSTPGLTKMINYFVVNDRFRIVDLPGYGYAKTGHKHIANWAGLMEKYLICSPNLKTVFVLVDCRHEPSELDKMMLELSLFKTKSCEKSLSDFGSLRNIFVDRRDLHAILSCHSFKRSCLGLFNLRDSLGFVDFGDCFQRNQYV